MRRNTIAWVRVPPQAPLRVTDADGNDRLARGVAHYPLRLQHRATRFPVYRESASVVLRLSCCPSSRSWFSSLMRTVNLSWSCSIAIFAVSSRKRARSFSCFVSTGPFPGQLPNGQCSDFVDMFVHRGTEFGHYTCKFRIVRRNRFGAEFTNAVA